MTMNYGTARHNSKRTKSARAVLKTIALLSGAAVMAPVALSLPAAAQAQTGVVAPISALYGALGRIQAQNSGSAQARAQIIGPVVDQVFDLPTVLHNSVGMRYASLSPDEQQKLLTAFRQFTVARYVSSFKPGTGAQFSVAPTTRPAPLGGGQIVDTKIGSSSDNGTAIDYVMKSASGSYRIVDVLLNGHISQVAAQRADFSSTLSRGGVDGLVALLNRKTQAFMND